MARVALTFDGDNRGAVQAATGTVAAIDKVKVSAEVSAQATVDAAVKQRTALQDVARQYALIAAAAEKGSVQQVEAAKLAYKAEEQLGGAHSQVAVAASGMAKETKNAEKETSQLTRGLVAGSGAAGGLTRALLLGSASFLAADGFVAAARAGIKEAASLETQLEQTSKTFGENANDIKAWSKDSSDSLLLSRTAALQAANQFGTLLKNVGEAPDKVAPLSKSLVQLAADLSAAKGVDFQTAMSAIQSLLAGRTTGMKALGVVIDASALKEEAYSSGIAKTTVSTAKLSAAQTDAEIKQYDLTKAVTAHGAQSAEAAQARLALAAAEDKVTKAQSGQAAGLTSQQKALAGINILFKQTGDEQGYIAGHTDDLAVQQAKLHAQIQDLEGELGTALIPVLEKYLPMLTDWISKNDKNGTFQKDFNTVVHDGVAIVEGLSGVVKTAVGIFDNFADAVGGDKKAFELLAGVLAGAKLAGGFSALLGKGGLGGVSSESTVATTNVGKLQSSLLGLSKLGAISVIVDLIINKPSIDSWIKKNIPGGKYLDNGAYQDIQSLLSGTGGSGGTAAVNTTATQKSLVDTAIELGPSNPSGIYDNQGTPGTGQTVILDGAEHQAFDCSGYLQAIYAKNGITIPRSSEAQWNDPNAINIPAGQEAAGDGVYFIGDGTYQPPGHCGIYIGGGKFIEYYQSGKPARISTLKGYPGYMGARRWVSIVQDTAGANSPNNKGGTAGVGTNPTTTGGKTTTPTTATPTVPDPFVEKAKKAKTTPLERTVASLGKSVDDTIAKTNLSLKQNLLAPDIAAEIDKRAQGIKKSLATATTADIPGIKARMADLSKATSEGLKQVADETSVDGSIRKVNTALSTGLISQKTADTITARGAKLMLSLADKLGDPSKVKAAVTAYNKQVATLLKDAATSQTIDKNLKTETAGVNTDLANQLLTPALAATLSAKAAAINAQVAKDLYNPAKLKADGAAATALKTTIKNAMAQVAAAAADESAIVKIGTDFAANLQQALGEPVVHATAQATSDAEKGAAAIRTELDGTKVLPASTISKLKSQLTVYENTIQDGLAGILQSVTDSQTGFETAFGNLSSGTLDQFDKDTQTKLTSMQKDAAAAIQALQVTVQGSGFASFLYGGSTTQTPTEALLAQMQLQHQTAGDASSVSDAQAALTAAQAALAAGGTGIPTGPTTVTTQQSLPGGITLTGADPTVDPTAQAALQQAVVDAQKALDDALYQQQTDALQQQADLERTAADAQLTAAQNAANDQETTAEQSYSDQRDTQRTALTTMLSDAQTALEQGKTTLAAVATEIGGSLAGGLSAGLLPAFDPTNPNSMAGQLNTFLGNVAAAQNALAALPGAPASADGTPDDSGTDVGAFDPGVGTSPNDRGGVAGVGQANSFLWGGIVWGPNDKAAFASWLSAHGSSLADWKANHPAAAAAVGYYRGGTVGGVYVGQQDTIMARVTPGEEVVDRSTATKLRDFLDNDGDSGDHYHVHIHTPSIIGANPRQVEDQIGRIAQAGINRLITIPMRR